MQTYTVFARSPLFQAHKIIHMSNNIRTNVTTRRTNISKNRLREFAQLAIPVEDPRGVGGMRLLILIVVAILFNRQVSIFGYFYGYIVIFLFMVISFFFFFGTFPNNITLDHKWKAMKKKKKCNEKPKITIQNSRYVNYARHTFLEKVHVSLFWEGNNILPPQWPEFSKSLKLMSQRIRVFAVHAFSIRT